MAARADAERVVAGDARHGTTADDIMALLAAKHSTDVFVSECKNGSSWNGSERMDGWAMLKTWSPFTTIGYEVKIARSDFLRDVKWHKYLPACHEFYFVCPKGLIQPDELPSSVGLLHPGGQRLVTKRKAARREPDQTALAMLMAYVLMSRTRIVGNWREANDSGKLEMWRAWLADKNDRQRVGHAASKRLREVVEDERRKRQQAESERDRLQGVKDTLAALGFEGQAAEWTVKNAASRAPLFETLRQIQRHVKQISQAIDRDIAEEEARVRSAEAIA